MASKDKESAILFGEEQPTTRKASKKDLEAKVAKLEMSFGDALDDITKLEERVGALEDKEGEGKEGEGEVAQSLVNQMAEVLRSEMCAIRDSLSGELRAVKELVESLKGDIALCKAAVAGVATMGVGPKLKVPEPPRFEGKRDPKALDNFLWGVERYFEAMHIMDDASKISTATMYLSDDAILWWRRRQEDIKKGLCSIAKWDEFKTDLKGQFYPENAEELAMKKLRGLRQTGQIRDYINAYSSLMLEIPEMEEKTRLIFFMDGLQRWAEQELRRRRVKTLAEAIAVAESLGEVSSGSRREKGKQVEESDQDKEEALVQPRVNQAYGKDKAQSKGDSRSEEGKSRKPLACFLCGGPHMARTCPQRQRLNAIIANLGEESAPMRMGAMVRGEGAQLANMRLLNAAAIEETEPKDGASSINGDVEEGVPKGEAHSATEASSIKQGGNLVFVNGEVNEGYARVLIDTGASHNFLALREAKNLGIKFTKVDGEMKAVNTEATPVHGRAWKVPIRLGKWKGKVDFLVVDMDDEDVVLGMEFLSNVAPVIFGDGVITITHKGCKHEIKLAKVKEDGARITSLKAWWALSLKRQGSVRRQVGNSVPRVRHQQGVPSASMGLKCGGSRRDEAATHGSIQRTSGALDRVAGTYSKGRP